MILELLLWLIFVTFTISYLLALVVLIGALYYFIKELNL